MTDTELAAVLAEKLFNWRLVRLPLTATCGDKDAHLRPDQTYPVLIIVGDLPPECWYTPTGWHEWDIGTPAVADEIMERLRDRNIAVLIESVHYGSRVDYRAQTSVIAARVSDSDWKRALVLAAARAVGG
jgi:hypothetical protein